jgi:hypothetical protein
LIPIDDIMKYEKPSMQVSDDIVTQ